MIENLLQKITINYNSFQNWRKLLKSVSRGEAALRAAVENRLSDLTSKLTEHLQNMSDGIVIEGGGIESVQFEYTSKCHKDRS